MGPTGPGNRPPKIPHRTKLEKVGGGMFDFLLKAGVPLAVAYGGATLTEPILSSRILTSPEAQELDLRKQRKEDLEKRIKIITDRQRQFSGGKEITPSGAVKEWFDRLGKQDMDTSVNALRIELGKIQIQEIPRFVVMWMMWYVSFLFILYYFSDGIKQLIESRRRNAIERGIIDKANIALMEIDTKVEQLTSQVKEILLKLEEKSTSQVSEVEAKELKTKLDQALLEIESLKREVVNLANQNQ